MPATTEGKRFNEKIGELISEEAKMQGRTDLIKKNVKSTVLYVLSEDNYTLRIVNGRMADILQLMLYYDLPEWEVLLKQAVEGKEKGNELEAKQRKDEGKKPLGIV